MFGMKCWQGATIPLFALAVYLSLAVVSSRARGAETGDYDGDGRLSIRDVVHFVEQIGIPLLDRDLAPGSLDGFTAHPCWEDWQSKDDPPEFSPVNGFLSGPVYLESLRRAVPDPLPHWEPLWEASPAVVRPDPDPRVEISWGESPAVYEDGWATLSLRLRADVALQAFSIIIESEGQVLRVPVLDAPRNQDDFLVQHWLMVHSVRDKGELHSLGDIPVRVGFAPFLITNGRFVIGYGLDFRSPYQEVIPPGERTVIVRARIPRGTPAGAYALSLLPTAEVLTADGELLTPAMPNGVDLTVDEDVTIDWNDGIPPLQFDLENRRIVGPIAFRVVEAEALPGEEVLLKIQMRTETPLNQFYIRARWDNAALECAADRATILYNNEAREPVISRLFNGNCSPGGSGFIGGVELELLLAGAEDRMLPANPERVLEYFRPLGEWIDILELPLRIHPWVAGGERIPIELRLSKNPFPAGVARGWPTSQFWPYGANWNCGARFPDREYRMNWTYEFHLEDGAITVLGDAPGRPAPPQPASGVRWILQDASGEPGDLVRVPILLSAEVAPLAEFILALEVEPPVTEIDAIVIESRSIRTGEIHELIAPRGGRDFIRECEGEPDPFNLFDNVCTSGIPKTVSNDDLAVLDAHRAYISINPNGDDHELEWPGQDLRRIGHLLVRIPEDYERDVIHVRHSAVPVSQSPWDFEVSSGARVFVHLLEPRTFTGSFSPAVETRDAVIYVGAGAAFIRGEVNGDGAINLADAVSVLLHLFAGGDEPTCMKAADANDDGGVDVGDSIFLLTSLFGGGGALPEPRNRCGFDRTRDTLTCDVAPLCGG